MTTIEIVKASLPFLALWIALCLACALRVTRRRRTGDSQVVGDPFFFPFREMPIVPERQAAAGAFVASIQYRCLHERRPDAAGRPLGIPQTKLTPSAGALRRNENGGRQRLVSSLSSGPAVVLTFPQVQR